MSTYPNPNPVFGLAPIFGCGVLGTANTALTAPGGGTVATIITATVNSLIHVVRFKMTVTSSAGMWRLWHYDGATYYLIDEINIPVVTVSATQGAYAFDYYVPGGILLPEGHSLRATTEKSEAAVACAYGETLGRAA